jgi:hypothetical protein
MKQKTIYCNLNTHLILLALTFFHDVWCCIIWISCALYDVVLSGDCMLSMMLYCRGLYVLYDVVLSGDCMFCMMLYCREIVCFVWCCIVGRLYVLYDVVLSGDCMFCMMLYCRDIVCYVWCYIVGRLYVLYYIASYITYNIPTIQHHTKHTISRQYSIILNIQSPDNTTSYKTYNLPTI